MGSRPQLIKNFLAQCGTKKKMNLSSLLNNKTHAQRFKHTSNNSMGCDAADVNNDGLLDLITLDMLPENTNRFMTLMGPKDYDYVTVSERNGYGKQYMKNALQVNRGDGYFSDLSYLYGVARINIGHLCHQDHSGISYRSTINSGHGIGHIGCYIFEYI
jgi:hypothetical protein